MYAYIYIYIYESQYTNFRLRVRRRIDTPFSFKFKQIRIVLFLKSGIESSLENEFIKWNKLEQIVWILQVEEQTIENLFLLSLFKQWKMIAFLLETFRFLWQRLSLIPKICSYPFHSTTKEQHCPVFKNTLWFQRRIFQQWFSIHRVLVPRPIYLYRYIRVRLKVWRRKDNPLCYWKRNPS